MRKNLTKSTHNEVDNLLLQSTNENKSAASKSHLQQKIVAKDKSTKNFLFNVCFYCLGFNMQIKYIGLEIANPA